MSIKQLREAKCDNCKRIFYLSLVPKKNEGKVLSQINEITYWTNGKKWDKFEILCRVCLNNWFENYHLDFTDLVEKDKRKLFYHYRYQGFLTKKGKYIKNKLNSNEVLFFLASTLTLNE